MMYGMYPPKMYGMYPPKMYGMYPPKNNWTIYPQVGGGAVQAKTALPAPIKLQQGTNKMASVWDTITSNINFDSIVKGSTSLIALRTQVQNMHNAKAAAAQQQQMTALQIQQMQAQQQQAAPVAGYQVTAAAPINNHTALYIGGAIVVGVLGFMMARRK